MFLYNSILLHVHPFACAKTQSILHHPILLHVQNRSDIYTTLSFCMWSSIEAFTLLYSSLCGKKWKLLKGFTLLHLESIEATTLFCSSSCRKNRAFTLINTSTFKNHEDLYTTLQFYVSQKVDAFTQLNPSTDSKSQRPQHHCMLHVERHRRLYTALLAYMLKSIGLLHPSTLIPFNIALPFYMQRSVEQSFLQNMLPYT